MYVALTRGRNDQRTYTIGPARVRDVPELPILADERSATEALAQSLNKQRSADLATLLDPDAAQIARDAGRAFHELAEGRARVLAQQRIAAAAINNPDRITVAALGPRPRRGPDRGLWDRAVGDAAIYRARWQEPEVTLDGSVSNPVAGRSRSRSDHYERVQAAVDAAHERFIDRLPLGELIERWHAADRQLPEEHAPAMWLTKVELDRARTEHREALARVTDAEARLDKAKTTRTKPWRRPDPDAINRATSGLDTAQANARKREIQVRRIERRLAAERTNQLARRPHQATIATLRRSINRRIDHALDHPAGYLLNVVGPRPKQRDKLETWTRTARAIEKYRHYTGRTPAAGPIGKGRIAAAIGPKPKGGLEIWTDAKQTIHEFDNPRRREQVLRRTR